jgi:hypothetical protein
MMAECQECFGSGLAKAKETVRVLGRPGEYYVFLDGPCPECGGSGIEHCCEGLREQPSDDSTGL